MGAIAKDSKRLSSYAKLKRTVDQTKFDAAIGQFINNFEMMVNTMTKCLSGYFVAKGLKEEKMVEYLFSGMTANMICENLSAMYSYAYPRDKDGLKDLKKLQRKISQVIENRNTIIHAIRVNVAAEYISINMKKIRRGKADASLKHTTKDIQRNSIYLQDLSANLALLDFQGEGSKTFKAVREKFFKLTVPSIGQPNERNKT